MNKFYVEGNTGVGSSPITVIGLFSAWPGLSSTPRKKSFVTRKWIACEKCETVARISGSSRFRKSESRFEKGFGGGPFGRGAGRRIVGAFILGVFGGALTSGFGVLSPSASEVAAREVPSDVSTGRLACPIDTTGNLEETASISGSTSEHESKSESESELSDFAISF